jgi:hypothetical protein
MQFRILWPIAGLLPALIKIHFLAGNQNGNEFSRIIPLEQVYDEGRNPHEPLGMGDVFCKLIDLHISKANYPETLTKPTEWVK